MGRKKKDQTEEIKQEPQKGRKGEKQEEKSSKKVVHKKKSFKSLIAFFVVIAVFAVGGFLLFTQTDFISKTCTVVYNTNGGEMESATVIEVNKGSTVELPTPTKTGYTFLGWYVGDVQWTNDTKFTTKTTLIAKWEARQYNITFVVNGTPHVQQCDYGTTPAYTGSTDKAPTTTIVYTFTGWMPAVVSVTADATYTAQYSESTRHYSISAASNISGVGSITGAGNDFVYQDDTTIATTAVDGYIFQGWFANGTLYTEELSFNIIDIDEDLTFEARYQIITKTITYHNLFDKTNPNPTTYNINDGIIVLQDLDLSGTGYNFEGWFTEDNGAGTKVTQIDSSLLQDRIVYGHRTIINYSITYNSTFGATNTNPTTYNVLSGTIVLANLDLSGTGYNFAGWWTGANGTGTQITSIAPTDFTNYVLYGHRTIITYTISYFDLPTGAVNTNETSFTVLTVGFALTDLELTTLGYDFDGWFTDANGAGTHITTIDTLQNYELYCAKTAILYNIAYTLNGGSLEAGKTNPATYTVETATFTLFNPSKADHNFLGWTGTGLSQATTSVTIPLGSMGDRNYVATFKNMYEVNLAYIVDGMNLTAAGGTREKNIVLNAAPDIVTRDYGMSGYTIDGWYTDASCETQYTFPLTLDDDYTLYGKWVYITDVGNGFFNSLTKFETCSPTQSIVIDSFEELVNWCDYVAFNDITDTAYKFTFGYMSPASAEAGLAVIEEAIEQGAFPRVGVGYGAMEQGGTKYFHVAVAGSTRSTDATLIADPDKSQVYEQQAYAYTQENASPRSVGYTIFNRDNIVQSVQVETSNQLMYVLQMGLKPVCRSGSAAQSVYNKARNILKQICNDSMTDTEKMRAIYEWIILNVYYDNKAVATASISNNWKQYKSWYAEGVFDEGVAVCDGISKALVIMAGIENIPAVRVSGFYQVNNNPNYGHAWNKVYVDGHWYCMDVTHGNLAIGDMEVVSYERFLMTDAENLARTAYPTTWESIVCNTSFDFYNYVEFDNGITTFDLDVDDVAELTNILKYVKTFDQGDATYWTIHVQWSMSTDNISTTIGTASSAAGVTYSGYTSHLQNTVKDKHSYIIFFS